MIGAVASTAASAYAASTRTATAPTATTGETRQQGFGAATELTLSEQARGVASLKDLDFSFDPAVNMQKADKYLAEAMRKLGIPPGTDMDIHLTSSGQFSVKGDDPKLGELEARLNDGREMDLRNALIATHVSATMHRIAEATSQTQEKVDANPAATEMLWNQLLARADAIGRQSMDFSYSGGSLNGTFTDGTSATA